MSQSTEHKGVSDRDPTALTAEEIVAEIGALLAELTGYIGTGNGIDGAVPG